MNHSTNNLKHTVWECKYHVAFIPKYRKKVIYGGLRSELDSSGFGTAERGRGGGGTSDERPCAHAVVDTTEVLSVRGGGVYQRGRVQ
jgi:hypothetical protein